MTTTWILASALACAQPAPADWPEAVAKKIDEVLAVKKEAMALPQMRSKNGALGKRAAKLMDELAALAKPANSPAGLEERAASDIRARILLWALDRAGRKPEYERFAEYYVNRPETREAAIEYFTRPYLDAVRKDPSGFLKKRLARDPAYLVPRPGTWEPNPVEERDKKEENRLIMEYCYFMPPTGRPFGRDNYRGNIGRTLRELDPDASLLVFAEDARIALLAIKQNGLDAFPKGNDLSLRLLFKIITPESYSVLSNSWKHPVGRKSIRDFISLYWADEWQWYGKYPETLQEHQAWTALAKRPWKRECEKEFAEWILSVPAPKDPYPPKPKGEARKP